MQANKSGRLTEAQKMKSTVDSSTIGRRTEVFRDLRVNFDQVVKSGLLYKKGDILRLYNKQYLFYLERRNNDSGPYLKFGPKGKNVDHFIDLGIQEV
jgi:hypothetical protein